MLKEPFYLCFKSSLFFVQCIFDCIKPTSTRVTLRYSVNTSHLRSSLVSFLLHCARLCTAATQFHAGTRVHCLLAQENYLVICCPCLPGRKPIDCSKSWLHSSRGTAAWTRCRAVTHTRTFLGEKKKMPCVVVISALVCSKCSINQRLFLRP